MIRIESIKYKKASAEICVNGEVIRNISIEALVKSQVKVGLIPDEIYSEFLKENFKQNAKKSLIASISRNLKSERDIRIKLFQKGYPENAIDYAVSFAKEYGYVDDCAYARSYVSLGLLTKGEHRLRYELRSKGIADEIIDECLSSVSGSQGESATRMAEKYMKDKEITPKNLEKLYRYLVFRGYDYEMVKDIVSSYRIDC